MPHQAYIADVMNELDPRTGELWYDKVVIIMPRRAGKTYLERSIITERCSRSRHQAAMTAQTGKTAGDLWAEVVYRDPDSIEKAPGMSGVLHVTTGNSNELCEWPNGSTFVPFAPVESSLHGMALDTVWVTELWAHSLKTKHELQAAYRPMWSMKPGQEILESAAGTSRSAWLKAERAAGIEATFDPLSRTAFFMWGVPQSAEELAALSDEELVRVCLDHHPRAGRGLRPEFLLSELSDPDRGRGDFLRAYCSVDMDDSQASLVPRAIFEAKRSNVRVPFGSRVCVGVAQDDEMRETTVAVGWRRPDGVVQTDTVRSEPGVRWAEQYVADMPDVAAVAVVNAKLGRRLANVVEKLDDGPAVLRVSGSDMLTGSQDWLAAMTETVTVDGTPEGLAHDGSRELRDALSHAEITPRAGLRSVDGEPVTAAAAHILARYAVLNQPEEVHDEPAEFWIY